MQRFDRYVLSQLVTLFGFFALVLVLVYWVNRAVILFDRLVADGHSAGVFLEFTALSLPSVIAFVIPIASFAAAVYVTNRLSNDCELTVVQAAGYSPWRLARPVLVFGVLVAAMTTVLTHVLVPASLEQLRVREQQISGDLTARLLREGAFLHPAPGVTFYVRDITTEGELRDVLLADRRSPAREVIYTAERAYLVRDAAGPKLVMLDGMAQTLDGAARRLSTTNFGDLTYDVSGLVRPGRARRRDLDYVPTAELLRDTRAIAKETREKPGEVLEEAHTRFQQAAICIATALVGYAALIGGGYSRFGVTRRIVLAVFLFVLVKVVESAVTEPVRGDARLWPLVYAPTLTGFAVSGWLLARASAARRSPQPAPTAGAAT